MTKKQIEKVGFEYDPQFDIYHIDNPDSAISIKTHNDNYIEIQDAGDPRFAGNCEDVETLKLLLSLIKTKV